MNDLDLLRAYEPVVYFTYGEHFFPTAVDGYLRQCSLWSLDAQGNRMQVAAEGDVTAGNLGRLAETAAGRETYLRFQAEPLNAVEYQQWLSRPGRPVFRAPSRFARVGLVSRLASSFMDVSLLVRGAVPGGTAAAAEIHYRAIQAEDPRDVYYGRVVRDGGYVVLHYVFFYAMNDWRSGFKGVNDHEADWEQIFVYLAENQSGGLSPQWVAYASHDFVGDELRRRWDDPSLTLVDGCHPAIYAGAGSHASYFLPGEYLTGFRPRFLDPLVPIGMAVRRFWADTLRQGDAGQTRRDVNTLFSIPYVDYARGDGVAIGPGQARQWSPLLMDGQDWAETYRGLWGLDTGDPLGGERAPAGPKFNREGVVRLSWYNPLAWAGLDKVSPPLRAVPDIEHRMATLETQRSELDSAIATEQEGVRYRELEVAALAGDEGAKALYETALHRLAREQAALQGLTRQRLEVEETLAALRQLLAQRQAGDWGRPDAHLKHPHRPEPPLPPWSRAVDVWAAVSGAVLVLAVVAAVVFGSVYWYLWIPLVIGILLAVEAALRARLVAFLINVTIVLTFVTVFILLLNYWRWALVAGVLFLVWTILRDNLREVVGR